MGKGNTEDQRWTCLPLQFLKERQRGLDLAETEKARRVMRVISGV